MLSIYNKIKHSPAPISFSIKCNNKTTNNHNRTDTITNRTYTYIFIGSLLNVFMFTSNNAFACIVSNALVFTRAIGSYLLTTGPQ